MSPQSIKNHLLIFSFALGVVISFQNCSKVNFDGNSTDAQVAFSDLNQSQLPDLVEDHHTGTPGKDDCKDPKDTITPEQCRLVSKTEVSTQEGIHLVTCSQDSDVKCALVCHVPRGNPDARHNIIIGLPARLGPHQPGGHGGDYDGPCSEVEETFEACLGN